MRTRSATAISFDYGHVLAGLDLVALARRLADEHETLASVDALRAKVREAYAAHDAAIAAGRGHEGAWRALMDTLVAVGCGDVSQRARIVDALWRAQPTRNLWRDVPPESRALLRDLHAAHVPMVVVSNSEGRARALIEEVDLARYFVDVVDSGVIGVSKPDPRIFARAAEILGVPLSSIVHVGDSEAADVVGAKAAGAITIRFDAFVPGAEATPTIADARAKTFAELRICLGRVLGVALHPMVD